MTVNNTRDKTTMTPPRLTLVRNTDDIESRDEEPVGEIPAGEASRGDADATTDATTGGGEVLHASIEQPDSAVAALAEQGRREKLRILEAVLFAAPQPLDETEIAAHLVDGEDIAALLADLQREYAPRGINLTRVAGKWAFRTADDLSFLLQRFAHEERKLSKAALETLSIIAYHQPVTRAEIEEIRGVTTSAGTIDILLETHWIRPRGRRRAPGRPVTYGTTEAFLSHFGLESIKDLPGLAELKGAGLLDATLPPGFSMPEPRDIAALMPDELPLDAADDEADEGQGTLEFEDGEDADGAAEGEAASGRTATSASTAGQDDAEDDRQS